MTPCKDCTERQPACQDTCIKLMAYKMAKKDKAIKVKAINDDYKRLNKGSRKGRVADGSGYYRKGYQR